MDSTKRGDTSMHAFIEAIGAMSEMTLIFYRNTLNAGATVEEAVRLTQAFISASLFGSGSNQKSTDE